MELLGTFGLLILGAIFLYLGAEGLVRGTVSLALRVGFKPLIAGVVFFTLGAASPELFVSFKSAANSDFDFALGNIVGSVIMNIGFILGISAIIKPLRLNAHLIKFYVFVLIVVSILIIALFYDRELSRVDGIILLLVFALYTFLLIKFSKDEQREVVKEYIAKYSNLRKKNILSIIFLIGSIALLSIGSNFFIYSIKIIGKSFLIPDYIMSLTAIALVCSLPELVIAIVSALRDQGDISIGNVFSTSIFNLLFVLGLISIFYPIQMIGITKIDLYVLMGMPVLFLPLARTGYYVNRFEGLLLLIAYLVYLYYLFFLR
ncbi:MAG: calcium/sodium antiporter [Candidatus Kapabacteria bacterium]|nr:calcium/sodium antiporter [Candidatus Kapabacteria bacterium]